MKDNELVSIILPVWNNMKYLPDWFDTFREKTVYENFELIVIDQGSTDGTIGFIQEQPEVTLLIKNQVNTGSTGAWNQGINASKSDYYLIMNSDIKFLYKGWIQRMLDEVTDKTGIVECLEIIWDKSTRWAGAAGFLLTEEAVKFIGLFDEKTFWGFCGDTDYWMRVAISGLEIKWCKDIVFFHWCGGTHRTGQLKETQHKDWDEGNERLRKKWHQVDIHRGWNVPRAEAEAWLQKERAEKRLS